MCEQKQNFLIEIMQGHQSCKSFLIRNTFFVIVKSYFSDSVEDSLALFNPAVVSSSSTMFYSALVQKQVSVEFSFYLFVFLQW